MLLQGLRQSWDLESIFKGGSRSEELLAAIGRIEKQLADLNQKSRAFNFRRKPFRRLLKAFSKTPRLSMNVYLLSDV